MQACLSRLFFQSLCACFAPAKRTGRSNVTKNASAQTTQSKSPLAQPKANTAIYYEKTNKYVHILHIYPYNSRALAPQRQRQRPKRARDKTQHILCICQAAELPALLAAISSFFFFFFPVILQLFSPSRTAHI